MDLLSLELTPWRTGGTQARRTLVHGLYRAQWLHIGTSFATACAWMMVCFHQSGGAGFDGIASWGLAMALALAARSTCGLVYAHRAQGTDALDPYWEPLWYTFTALTTALWGVAWLWVAPNQPFVQSSLTLCVSCSILAGAPLVARSEKAFYALIVPALPPALWALLLEQSFEGAMLAAATLGSAGLAYLAGRQLNIEFQDLVQQREKNSAIVQRLRSQTEDAAKSREEAEQMNRAKTRFFAAASHDLRQPLHAMGLYAATLTARLQDDTDLKLANAIGQSVEALESQFTALLDLAKLDSGIVIAERQTLAMAEIFQRLQRDFAPAASEKGLTLRVKALPSDLTVDSDPVMLERILSNLVSNAIRYTHAGGVLLTARRRGRAVQIAVWDTGVGISLENQARVFEEFFQVANHERDRRKGFGLGLSTVKRLSMLLHGELHLRSRPLRGSVFVLSQPHGRHPLAPTTALEKSILVNVDPLAKLKVIVIDDEMDILGAMQALLSSWGCHVLAAPSLASCLSQIEQLGDYPDLIISDYQLANGELGLEAVQALRSEFGMPIPALIVSAAMTPEANAAIEAAGDPLLSKPVSADKLREALLKISEHPEPPPVDSTRKPSP